MYKTVIEILPNKINLNKMSVASTFILFGSRGDGFSISGKGLGILKFGPLCPSPAILNKSSLDIEEDRVPSTPNKLLEELVVDEGDAFCLDEKLEEHLLPVLLTLSYALLLG